MNTSEIHELIRYMIKGIGDIPEDNIRIANVVWLESKRIGVSDDLAILHLGIASMQAMRDKAISELLIKYINTRGSE